MEKAIITASSNRYFPSLINLLGSIKNNYPQHPQIFIYDLGLFFTFRKELQLIQGVNIINMPRFCKHWRRCYSWKSYIFNNPLAHLNFYLDAGNQVLAPLDEIFKEINNNDYFAVSQGQSLEEIIPKEYISIFDLSSLQYRSEVLAAGIFGFKNNKKMMSILSAFYDCAIAGLTLGFSAEEIARNKGINKNIFTRNCSCFRHDQTILNILLRKNIENLKIHESPRYSCISQKQAPNQLIYNLRRKYKYKHLSLRCLHKNRPIYIITLPFLNRIIIGFYLLSAKKKKNFISMVHKIYTFAKNTSPLTLPRLRYKNKKR